MKTKNTIFVSLIAIAIIILVIFVLQNTDIVLVNFLNWTFSPTVAALIVFTFIIGVLCGLTIDIIFTMINNKKKANREIIAPTNKDSKTNNNSSQQNDKTKDKISEVENFTEKKDK